VSIKPTFVGRLASDPSEAKGSTIERNRVPTGGVGRGWLGQVGGVQVPNGELRKAGSGTRSASQYTSRNDFTST